jgi:hypothetical protein
VSDADARKLCSIKVRTGLKTATFQTHLINLLLAGISLTTVCFAITHSAI